MLAELMRLVRLVWEKQYCFIRSDKPPTGFINASALELTDTAMPDGANDVVKLVVRLRGINPVRVSRVRLKVIQAYEENRR